MVEDLYLHQRQWGQFFSTLPPLYNSVATSNGEYNGSSHLYIDPSLFSAALYNMPMHQKYSVAVSMASSTPFMADLQGGIQYQAGTMDYAYNGFSSYYEASRYEFSSLPQSSTYNYSLSENEKDEIKIAFGISKSSLVNLTISDLHEARRRRKIQEGKAWLQYEDHQCMASALISKLTEEKNYAIQQANKVRLELELLRSEASKSQGGVQFLYVVIIGLLGILIGYILKRT